MKGEKRKIQKDVVLDRPLELLKGSLVRGLMEGLN